MAASIGLRRVRIACRRPNALLISAFALVCWSSMVLELMPPLSVRFPPAPTWRSSCPGAFLASAFPSDPTVPNSCHHPSSHNAALPAEQGPRHRERRIAALSKGNAEVALYPTLRGFREEKRRVGLTSPSNIPNCIYCNEYDYQIRIVVHRVMASPGPAGIPPVQYQNRVAQACAVGCLASRGGGGSEAC